MHLGASRRALGDAEGARASYERAASLSPTDSEARRGVALVLRERGRLAEAHHWLSGARRIAPENAQLALDVGITFDYEERRHEAMHAYNLAWQLGSVRGASGSAVRGATNIEQARYLYGRAAKGMSLWRGWDAYNSYLRSSVRSAGGAARLAVDPVAALTSPFTGEELLLVVKASAALKLGGAADGASNPATRAEPPSDDGRRLSRGGERLVVGFVSSYFRDHNLLRLTRSLFTMADKSMVSHELFAESDDDGTHILRQTQRRRLVHTSPRWRRRMRCARWRASGCTSRSISTATTGTVRASRCALFTRRLARPHTHSSPPKLTRPSHPQTQSPVPVPHQVRFSPLPALCRANPPRLRLPGRGCAQHTLHVRRCGGRTCEYTTKALQLSAPLPLSPSNHLHPVTPDTRTSHREAHAPAAHVLLNDHAPVAR